MAFFEAKAAAVASALTLLIPVASFHSALSQENSVTDPARLAAQGGIPGFLLVHFDIAYADLTRVSKELRPGSFKASQSQEQVCRGTAKTHSSERAKRSQRNANVGRPLVRQLGAPRNCRKICRRGACSCMLIE